MKKKYWFSNSSIGDSLFRHDYSICIRIVRPFANARINAFIIMCVMIIVIFSIFGCTAIKPPSRVSSVYPTSVTDGIVAYYFKDGKYNILKEEYRNATTTPERKDEIADQIASELLRVHLKEYSDFTDALKSDRALKNVVLKSGSLALTSLATVLTPVSTTTALAAGASFLTGANEIHENENFGAKTTDAIITAMEALRAPIRIELDNEINKTKGTNLYKCEQLLVEYEAQASVDKALSYLSQIAAEKKSDNIRDAKAKVKSTQPGI